MKVGVRIHPHWLESEDDHDLRFLKHIGVDYVDITLDIVMGYAETGCFRREDLEQLTDCLDRAGLKIEWANALALHQVGYEGVIDFDHVMHISGDTHHGRQYIASAVGYMKGLLAGLPPK